MHTKRELVCFKRVIITKDFYRAYIIEVIAAFSKCSEKCRKGQNLVANTNKTSPDVGKFGCDNFSHISEYDVVLTMCFG